MDLSYSEEQLLLRDSASRFLTDRYRFDAPSLASAERAPPGAMWSAFADMGWLGLTLSGDHGGVEGGAVETILLMEQFGRALVRDPYLGAIVMGASAVAKAASPEQLDELLPQIVAGHMVCALADADAPGAVTAAAPDGDGWRLNGAKVRALDGAYATHFVVTARAPDGEALLFLVARDAQGVLVENRPLVGEGTAADLSLNSVAAPATTLLARGGAAERILAQCLDGAIIAAGAEALGCAETMLADTIEYVKVRQQFGRTLSQFQVIRHRIADLVLAVEEARAMVLFAALESEDDPDQLAAAASKVKVKAMASIREVAEQAIQLHGGIGLTNELRLGGYFTRLMLLEGLFGTADDHLSRLAALRRRREL